MRGREVAAAIPHRIASSAMRPRRGVCQYIAHAKRGSFYALIRIIRGGEASSLENHPSSNAIRSTLFLLGCE